MPERFKEQIVLFSSILKWTVYASVIGMLVGAGTSLFLISLQWSTKYVAGAHSYLWLPLAFFVSHYLIRALAPEAAGHGTEKVIEAVHARMGKIPLLVVPVKLVTTVVTLAFGGSAGKEGPCAQIGAGLASGFADLVRMNDQDRRKLVVCGISAGFASVFGTPVAGALFGVEVLFLGQILYEVLFPSLVAGIIGYHVSVWFGVTYFAVPVGNVPGFSEQGFLEAILLGVVCGVGAFALIESMKLAERLFDRVKWWKPLNGLIGGAILVIIGFAISPAYLGLGLPMVENGLHGWHMPFEAAAWKIVTTCTTLSCGGSGGIVTPIFFIGTALGNAFGQIADPAHVASFAAIGLVAMLAGAANTPISACVMSLEMFGPSIGPYAAIACVASFLIVGHRSIYPSQMMRIRKSPSVDVELGRPVSELGAIEFTPRESTWVGRFVTGVQERRRDRRKRDRDGV